MPCIWFVFLNNRLWLHITYTSYINWTYQRQFPLLWSTIMKKVFAFFLSCYLAILLASYFDLLWFCMTFVIGPSFTCLYSMNFCFWYSLSFVCRNLAAINFGGLLQPRPQSILKPSYCEYNKDEDEVDRTNLCHKYRRYSR